MTCWGLLECDLWERRGVPTFSPSDSATHEPLFQRFGACSRTWDHPMLWRPNTASYSDRMPTGPSASRPLEAASKSIRGSAEFRNLSAGNQSRVHRRWAAHNSALPLIDLLAASS